MRCKICKHKAKSATWFSRHLKTEHSLSSKDYYDTYIARKNEGTCWLQGCNKDTRFVSISVGYMKSCCQKHGFLLPKDKWLEGLQKTWASKSKEECKDIYKRRNSTIIKKYGKSSKELLKENLSKLCREHGVTNVSQIPELRDKANKSLRAVCEARSRAAKKSIRIKSEETSLLKYGARNWIEVPENRKRVQEEMYSSGKWTRPELADELHVFKYTCYAATKRILKSLGIINANVGKCGVKGAKQVDHITSITRAFQLDCSVDQVVHPANLQIISWRKNLRRRWESHSHTKRDLLYRIYLYENPNSCF